MTANVGWENLVDDALYFFLMIRGCIFQASLLKLAVPNNWEDTAEKSQNSMHSTQEKTVWSRGGERHVEGEDEGRLFVISNVETSCEWFAQKRFAVISSVISFKQTVERDRPADASIQYSISDHYFNPSTMSTMFLLLTLSSLIFQFFPSRGITPLWGWKVTLDRACSTLPNVIANRARSPSFGKREGTSCPSFSQVPNSPKTRMINGVLLLVFPCPNA